MRTGELNGVKECLEVEQEPLRVAERLSRRHGVVCFTRRTADNLERVDRGKQHMALVQACSVARYGVKTSQQNHLGLF
jgi:hypothetical protein